MNNYNDETSAITYTATQNCILLGHVRGINSGIEFYLDDVFIFQAINNSSGNSMYFPVQIPIYRGQTLSTALYCTGATFSGNIFAMK